MSPNQQFFLAFLTLVLPLLSAALVHWLNAKGRAEAAEDVELSEEALARVVTKIRDQHGPIATATVMDAVKLEAPHLAEQLIEAHTTAINTPAVLPMAKPGAP